MALPRRGLILPVVLMVLLLLGLLVAMFSFRVNADLAATQAVAFRMQTRLAAEAGVALVLLARPPDEQRHYHAREENKVSKRHDWQLLVDLDGLVVVLYAKHLISRVTSS